VTAPGRRISRDPTAARSSRMLTRVVVRETDDDSADVFAVAGEPEDVRRCCHDRGLTVRRVRGGRPGTAGPADPTRGGPVGSYATYAEAQRAVDHLADEGFPVEDMTSSASTSCWSAGPGAPVLGTGPGLGRGLGAWFRLLVGLLLGAFVRASRGRPVRARAARRAHRGAVRHGVRRCRLRPGPRVPRLHLGQSARGDPLRRAVRPRNVEKARAPIAKLELRGPAR
jgi:hypothetical protein